MNGKGTTINDLGAEEIFEMNLFFLVNPFRIKRFSSARPLKIYFFLESASQNLFFSREGPPKLFFLDFLWPHPQIINGRPLK